MRGLVSAILIFFFVLTFLLGLVSYSVSQALRADYIKQRLNEGKLYSVASTGLHPPEPGEKKPAIDEVTLQKRVESFVDDTFAYFEGKKQEKPSLDIAGLVNLENPNQKTKIELANAEKFKGYYQTLNRLPLVFGVASLILLLLIFLLGTTWSSKIRKTSTALFTAGFWGLVTGLLVLALGDFLVHALSSTISVGQFDALAAPLGKTLVAVPPFLTAKMVLISLGTLIAAFLLVSLSFFVKTKKELVAHLKFTQEDFVHSLDKLQKKAPDESRESISGIKTEAMRLRTRIYKEIIRRSPPLIK